MFPSVSQTMFESEAQAVAGAGKGITSLLLNSLMQI